MKILIVEDEHNSRIFLERRPKKEGYIIVAAANGAEPLARAQETRPDLVISHIMMPEMDGFEPCRRMKADDHLRGVPFLFHTATCMDPKDEQLAMASGGREIYCQTC